MFTREDTRAVKGMAVLMMLFHHLVAFPDRMPPDFEGFQTFWKAFADDGYLRMLASSCKICVSIFYFVGGYGLYKRWIADRFHLGKVIASMYRNYWKIFAVFVPAAFLFFHHMDEALPGIYRRYTVTDRKEILSLLLANLLGLTDSINSEWWFFRAYLCALPMGLVFCIADRKNKSFTIDAFLVFGIDILVRNVFPGIARTETFSGIGSNFYYANFLGLTSVPPFFAGIIFAKHNKLEAAKAVLERWRFSGIAGLLGCLAVLYVRSYILGEFIEIIHVTLFVIFLSVFLDGIGKCKKLFCIFGKYSTDLWLIHTFFCYYFYQTAKLVYLTRNVWIDFLILTALSMAGAVLTELLWKALALLKPKCQKWLLRPEKTAS